MTSNNTSRAQASSSPQRQQPTKSADPNLDTIIVATSALGWIAKLAKRLLAHSLNMPEPLLHDTGMFVFAHVQAVEDRAAKTLCPFSLLRQVIARRRNRHV